MDRRNFMFKAPATMVGVAVGGTVLSSSVKANPGEPTTEAPGFRLLEEHHEDVFSPETGEFFPLIQFVVDCPYPVGSNCWLAIADHENGRVVLLVTVLNTPCSPRRVIFPRFTAEDGDLDERARAIYRAVRENGFDNSGPDHEWGVVHVEHRCPDGVEHLMAGLPVSWDPRLVLGVMVKGQIK